MTPEQQYEIFSILKRAALMEHEAATVRLETARKEQECALRTLAMADRVAQSMVARELGN